MIDINKLKKIVCLQCGYKRQINSEDRRYEAKLGYFPFWCDGIRHKDDTHTRIYTTGYNKHASKGMYLSAELSEELVGAHPPKTLEE